MQRIPQSSALPDPMLQVTHFVESVQTRTGPQNNVFMLGQKLPWFGKLNSQKKKSSLEAEALWFLYQNQQLMLARNVSVAFFEYGFTDKSIQITSENLDLLKGLEPIVEDKVRSGGDINPLLRLKVEIGKVDDRLQSMRQMRIRQSAKLAELLALPEDTILPWPNWGAAQPELMDLNRASLITTIRDHHPGLLMLERKIESAEARREIARLQSFPDITLGINYIQVGDPVVNPNTPDASRDPWGITVAINLPIWFKKSDGAKAEALADKRAAENDYEGALNALKAELTASMSNIEDANRRLNLYGEELLDLARQAVENSLASYQAGRAGILEVIDSERSLLDLQLLYWRAFTDTWQQRVIIQTLANQPILGTFPATKNHE